tara:strand:- start:17 stop:898 length:882 start_codon:yes stop_codon:yes gene_type:complete
MNIGLILMKKCYECKSEETEYDETLGETVCKDCGLVLVTELFEETVHILDTKGNFRYSKDKGHLGSIISGKGSHKFNKFGKNSVIPKHIQNGLMHCNMVLGAVGPDLNLRERVEKLYLDLMTKNVFGKSQYEARATAVVYYVLKENGTPHSFADVASEFNPPIKVVKRLVRKINQLYRNSINYTPINPQYLLGQVLTKINTDNEFNRQCYKMLEHFEVKAQLSTFNKGRSYYACIAWLTANQKVRTDITKDSIAEKTGYSRWVIWRQTKSILQLVGLESVKELKGKELNEIGE